MNKKNLFIFGLILVNALIFAYVFDRMSAQLIHSTENSYTARGIDAYLK